MIFLRRVFAIGVVIATTAVPGQGRPDADAYRAVFELQFHETRAAMMAVKDVAVAMPTLSGASREWLAQFEDMPAARRRAASQTAPTQTRPLDVARSPAGIKVVSDAAIQRIFAEGLEQGWTVFRQQYGAGWLSLSEVLFTPDSLNALVYYEARCGTVCGESSYFWLHRHATGSPWSIAKRIIRSKS